MPKILKSKKQLKRSWQKTSKTFFAKPRFNILKKAKHKQQMLHKKKKYTNFFKAFNWHLLKFDLLKLLGRTYYIRKFVVTCILDLILVLSIIFSGFKLWLLVFAVPLGLRTLNSLREIIVDSFYRIKNKMFNNSLAEVARVGFSSGPPGTGKTSSKVYEARHKAKQLWTKLQEAYFFALRLNKDKLSNEQLNDYNAIVDSYEFYINHPQNIPCLWANIPIWDSNGNRCFKLTKKHLMQQDRLPQFSVLFNDEIGCQFKAKKGDSDDLDPLSELARFIRHFIDGYWDLTEQEISKTFIDLRRVGGSNKWFTSQEWKLKPYFLLSIYNSLKSTIMVDFNLSKLYKSGTSQYNSHLKKSKRQSKRWGGLLKLLKRYISYIGWRRYEYTELGNSQSKEMTENGVHVIYLPSCLNCRYDDRAYRNKYKPKNKSIEESVFTGKVLTDADLIEIFGEETKKKTKSKN